MKPGPRVEIEHLVRSLRTVVLSPDVSDGLREEIIQAARALEQLGRSLETLLPYLWDDNSRLATLLERIRRDHPDMICRSDMQLIDEPVVETTGLWLTDVERAATRNEELRGKLVEVIRASGSVATSRAVRGDVRSVLIDSLGRRPW